MVDKFTSNESGHTYVRFEDYAALMKEMESLVAENDQWREWAAGVEELWSAGCDLDLHLNKTPSRQK